MKVTMTAHVTGQRNGEDWPKVGETLTVPDAEGADLCANGIATPVAEPAKASKATAKKSEKR